MEITGERHIPAPREKVWQALNDPQVLKECIPGCEQVEKVSDTEFTAKMVAKVGPVKAKFDTRINLENLVPPESYTLTGSGQGGIAGFARGGANISLKDVEGGTTLIYDADMQIGGKLAQVGSRLVKGTANKIIGNFFDNFVEKVGQG